MTTTSSTRNAARSGDLLHGLALLNTNWEQGRSFIDNFRPFVVDACRCIESPFTAEQVRAEITEAWGIDMPVGVVTNVLRRLVRDGLVKALGRRQNSREYTTTEDLRASASLKSRSQAVLREHESLLDSLIQFAGTREYELSREEAESLLVDFLQMYAIPVLRRSVEGDFLPTFDDSLVAEFIIELNERHPTEMQYVISLVKGNIIRSALYLDDFSRIEQRFRDTTAYLDTPFVLEALGVAGHVLQQAALEELELAKSLGIRLACFKITVTEIRNVITSAAGQVRSGKTAVDTTSRVVMLGTSALNLLVVTLENRLAQLGVQIVERPDYVDVDATVEADLRAVLERRINYRNENALEHDLRAIVAIHRLRRGKSTARIEESHAIFLTTNSTLVAAAREAVPPADRVAAPLAIVDHEFASLLWLKKPLAGPDLPRRQVIADCFAALNPPEAAWAEYLRQLEALRKSGTIDEATYLAARDGYEAQRLVTTMTRGSVDELSPSLGIDVVEALRLQLSDAEREKAAQERAELEERYKLDLTELEQEASELEERVALAVQAGEEKAAQARNEGELAGRAAALHVVADLAGRAAGWIVRVPLMVLLLFAVAIGVNQALTPDSLIISGIPYGVGAVLFLIMQSMDSVFKLPARTLVDRLCGWVSRGVSDWVGRRLGVHSNESPV